jgi:hypothetical protein
MSQKNDQCVELVHYYPEDAVGLIGNAYVSPWKDFFAFFPIKTIRGKWIWFVIAQRRQIETNYLSPWEFRNKPKGV